MDLPVDFPSTLTAFEDRFSDEDTCRDYLAKMRWPEGFICPVCSGRTGWRLANRDLFECATCGRQTSLTAGTVFHGTRKPLRVWFRVMFLMMAQKNGMSAKSLQRLMGFGSYQTAWAWLHKLRRAIARRPRTELSGSVEADDAYIGGPVEGCTGRGTTKPAVAVAVERRGTGMGRVRIEPVEDVSQPSLFTFVVNNVQRGSEVVTDGLVGYAELPDAGYLHRPRVIGADSKRAARLLPRVHRAISLFKRWVLGTHQGSASSKHLRAYCDEYEFRFNRRNSGHRVKLFHRLMEVAVTTSPPTFRQLVEAT